MLLTYLVGLLSGGPREIKNNNTNRRQRTYDEEQKEKTDSRDGVRGRKETRTRMGGRKESRGKNHHTTTKLHYTTLQSIPGQTRYPRPNPTTQQGQVGAAIGHQGRPPASFCRSRQDPVSRQGQSRGIAGRQRDLVAPGPTAIPLCASLPVLPKPPYRRPRRRGT